MSSNPFRKKTAAATGSFRTSSPKSSMCCDDHLAASDDMEKKPFKRVRVLSPPPLSPDDLKWNMDESHPLGSLSDDTPDVSNYYPTSDPFSGTSTDESDCDSVITLASVPPPQNHDARDRATRNTTPANPFTKTLQHVEASDKLQSERKEEGAVLKAAHAGGRRPLNVDAFRSLLMTGRVDDDATSMPIQRHESTAEKKSSTYLPGSLSNATPRTIHNADDDSDDSDDSSQDSCDEVLVKRDQEASIPVSSQQQINKDRKLPPRPPPPSSRHGKSIRQHESVPHLSRGAGDDVLTQALGARHQTLSSQRRSLDAGAQLATHGELEALPPQVESVVRRDNTSKKSAPAPPPPPRRGLPRPENTKVADIEGLRPTFPSAEPVFRSEGARPSGSVPAPPPSRRPHTAPRQSSQLSTSSMSSLKTTARTSRYSDDAVPAYSSPPSETPPLDSYSSKSSMPPVPPRPSFSQLVPPRPSFSQPVPLPPPPPPPPAARQSSTRRPPNLHTIESSHRHIAPETRSRGEGSSVVPPPPPPPRNRSTSGNNATFLKKSEANLPARHQPARDNSAGILADLDALQREVDALIGRIE
ncbi:hypothetical protein E4U21_000064 [Claviceps maximensis]|nr:hypothetical protein E4U21_000064 [Claviceps maximensis]